MVCGIYVVVVYDLIRYAMVWQGFVSYDVLTVWCGMAWYNRYGTYGLALGIGIGVKPSVTDPSPLATYLMEHSAMGTDSVTRIQSHKHDAFLLNTAQQ